MTPKILYNYSLFKASIGSSREAFRAGKTPKIIPIIVETETDKEKFF